MQISYLNVNYLLYSNMVGLQGDSHGPQFKFPDGIISAWEFQLEMTYTLSTLKGSAAKQTMNGTHASPQAIKIHLLYAYYGKKKSSRSLGSFKKQAADCAWSICKLFCFPHIHCLPRGQALWVQLSSEDDGLIVPCFLQETHISYNHRTLRDIGDILVQPPSYYEHLSTSCQ